MVQAFYCFINVSEQIHDILLLAVGIVAKTKTQHNIDHCKKSKFKNFLNNTKKKEKKPYSYHPALSEEISVHASNLPDNNVKKIHDLN